MTQDNACKNTDREIWRGPDEGNGSYYADSIHVTESGSIGLNVGGHVIVRPIREWHRLALPNTGEREKALEETVWMIEWPQDDNMPARWWHPQNGWMLDASKAVRFSRRQDAEAYRWIMRVAGTKVTEHKFIGNLHSRALKSTPAPVGEDVVERAKKEILHAINNHKTIVCQEDTWRDQSNEALALSVYRHLASANLLRKE